MRSRPVALALALLVSAAGLDAQECVGIPRAGHGFFGVGPAGSDGAGGTGMGFAYQGSNRSVLLAYQTLGVFAYAHQQKTRSAQANFRLNRVHGCLTAGLKWQSWNTDRADYSSWSADDPTVIIERHTIGGDYDRLRFPIGLSFGRAFDLKRISLVPYVNPYAVVELEDFQPLQMLKSNPDGPSESRRSLGGGFETGFALRAGWFVARPSMAITNTRDRALSGKRNWADLALHLGVVF